METRIGTLWLLRFLLLLAAVICFLLAFFGLNAPFSLPDLGLALGFGAFMLTSPTAP